MDPSVFPEGEAIEENQVFPEGEAIDEGSSQPGFFDAAKGAIRDFAEGTGEVAEKVAGQIKGGVKGAINFADEAYKASPDTPPMQSPFDIGTKVMSGLIGAGKVSKEKWDALGSNEKKAIITRLGAAVAGAVVSGGGSLVVQAASAALGGQLGGELSEELGYEKDTPFYSKEKLKEGAANFITGTLLNTVLSASGKATTKAGETVSRASVPVSELEKATLGKPGAMTGQLTVGKNTAGEMHLVKDMKAAEPTMSKVLLDEFPDTIKNADEFADSLNASISSRVAEKEGLISSFDKALDASKGQVSNFTLKDVGVPQLQKEIRRLKKTGISGDSVKALEGLRDDMLEAFSKPKGQGQTGRVWVRKNFQEMQDLLDEAYKKQRALKAFDDNALAQSGTNPGVMAANKEAIRVYQVTIDSLKKNVVRKATELERKGFLGNGKASRLGEVNGEIHDLIPWRDGADRFSYADYQTTKQVQPGSLMQPPGSPFAHGQSAKSMATDIATRPLTDPLIRRQAAREALDFAPGTYGNMQDAAKMTLGRMAVPGTEGQGVLGRLVGPGLEEAGGAMSTLASSGAIPAVVSSGAQSPLPVLGNPQQMTGTVLDFDAITNDPMSMEMLNADPDISPETHAALEQSQNGTRYEKNIALGKLKIDARNKGWFPPPPMQGIHSFITTPGQEYQGAPVKGIITDQNEAAVYLDAVNQIPDVSRRAQLKSAFNSPQGRYVLEFPKSLLPVPQPEKKPKTKEPEPIEDAGEGSSAKTSDGGDSLERVLHDY